MFGYVTPCKMELKIKDYEKFKAYYCGLCVAIKNNFGNVPRLALNYDMTFLAVLLDSLSEDKRSLKKSNCVIHPLKKRILIVDNKALNYSAFCNVILAYYKLLDDVDDKNSVKAKVFSKVLNTYIKNENIKLQPVKIYIKDRLNDLRKIELSDEVKSLDEISHPFADLTGYIISFYYREKSFNQSLYWLGYNLGKWIYIIDAWDDLEKDMHINKKGLIHSHLNKKGLIHGQQKKFNAIDASLNKDKLQYKEFAKLIEDRIDFVLTTCAHHSLQYLNKLTLNKNEDLLYNILQLGLMEKMNSVFKRSEVNNERPL